jgi:nucleoside-diphosphate-sugar epimerase
VSAARPTLVTGAGGFIGRHLVAALHARGVAVRALVRTRADADSLAAFCAEALVGDLLEADTVRRAARGAGAVFHLAGRLFEPGTDPQVYSRLHVDATLQLLDACQQEPPIAFFLHCSTTGIHGPTAGPAREDDPARPSNAYEETKARAEVVLRQRALATDTPLVIARPGLVYGPGDRHLVGWYRSIQRGYYRVIGPGTNHLHPIYIDDLVDALLRCASRATPEGRAYHLVGERPYTMRELSDAIGRAVGRCVPAVHLPVWLARTAGAAFELLPIPRRRLPLSRTRVAFLLQNREYDGTRAHGELGFVPQVPLQDGLARSITWYRAHGWL